MLALVFLSGSNRHDRRPVMPVDSENFLVQNEGAAVGNFERFLPEGHGLTGFNLS